MTLSVRTILGRVRLQRFQFRKCWNAYFMIISPLLVLSITFSTILLLRPQNAVLESPSRQHIGASSTTAPALDVDIQRKPKERHDCESCSPVGMHTISPYHNWETFMLDYEEMLRKLRIFVYPDAFTANESSPYATIFLPHSDPKIGNYYSEHAFKLALLRSTLLTRRPDEAHFFFMPFSINVMRYHPLLHSESSISSFVANYVARISAQFEFWNASGGADHFFVCCHSVGREAASKHHDLHNNAVQITCSSSYFQRLYTPRKDIALPQIWPRPSPSPSPNHEVLNPPNQRTELIFFAGRAQNSGARQEVLSLWGNDSSFSIFAGHSSMPYEEGFRRSRYCLHIKGYEVNTARAVDAIHYGCVPVLISNYYDLPFANILDWSKFSITVNQQDIPLLKDIITSVPEQTYLDLHHNLCLVRKHFRWSAVPESYDAFHMTAYQLWLRRGLGRVVS